jgi:hypothetical protein
MDLRRNTLPRLLAGLQVGILGGLSIFLWFLLLSYWGFRSPWGLLNLIAASLRNHATWGLALTSSTWTGLAAHLFLCGSLGMAVGWILPRPLPQVRISLSGFVFGIVLSLMAYELFWHRYVPLLGEYIRPAASLVSHLLFGLSLAQFPKFYHQLVDTHSTDSSEASGAVAMLPSIAADTGVEPAAETPDAGAGDQASGATAVTGSDSEMAPAGGREAVGEVEAHAAGAASAAEQDTPEAGPEGEMLSLIENRLGGDAEPQVDAAAPGDATTSSDRDAAPEDDRVPHRETEPRVDAPAPAATAASSDPVSRGDAAADDDPASHRDAAPRVDAVAPAATAASGDPVSRGDAAADDDPASHGDAAPRS